MSIDLLVMDGGLEALADDLDVFPYFLQEEIRGELFAVLAFLLVFVELDDAGVVEVTDLLKTCLEDVAFDVSVNLTEGFEFFHNLGADSPYRQFIISLVQ